MLNSIKETIAALKSLSDPADPAAAHKIQATIAASVARLARLSPTPRIRSARIMVGAHAYATIDHDQGRCDMRLDAGCSPATSLAAFAAQKEAEAMRALAMASLALAAADMIGNAGKTATAR